MKQIFVCNDTITGIFSAIYDAWKIVLSSGETGIALKGIRLRGREISSYNRDSQGVKLMNLDDGVSVVGIAKISEEDIEEEAEETAAEAEKTEVE